MRYARVVALAGSATLYATASLAADMTPIVQPPPLAPACIPRSSVPPGTVPNAPFCVEEFSGWYLRGDIGMTNQQVGSLFNTLNNTATSVNTIQKGFDSSMLFGVGIGYQWNSWLRTDLTGEYRSRANFHGLQVVNSGGTVFTDEYRGSKSEWLFLANAYVDLGTWWKITPFVGAGAGMSYNMISDFLDVNTPNSGVAFGANAAKWSFAWALHAGFSYKVTDSLTLELAYRYVNLGNGITGDLVTYQGANAVYNPTEFRNLSSHDIKVGVRWALDGGVEYAPAYTPPEPAYSAPTYVPPPSMYSTPSYQPSYQPGYTVNSRG
jgi:opacity protein-like surface antigen